MQMFNQTVGQSWPHQEALKIYQQIGEKPPEKGYVLFETGYGPSGLPHIGTFAEVVRTNMVIDVFKNYFPHIPTELRAFSDDMDGLRKVPDNVPNQEMLRKHLGKPLTKVPDPFGLYESFGHHNNAQLCSFLKDLGVDFQFFSSTESYEKGLFDEQLITILHRFDEFRELVLPILREERQSSYSPFLPISPVSGKVLEVPIESVNTKDNTIVYRAEDGKLYETPVTKGNCKLQWKIDWGMRMAAFDVNYEMLGADLISSIKIAREVVKKLGGRPPVNLIAQLFTDRDGKKISKSKGNGLSIEEFLRYGTKESLTLFMYKKPKTSKRLFFDVIPSHVDEYLQHLKKYPHQSVEKQVDNPVWHIHSGRPPRAEELGDITFDMLVNLASTAGKDLSSDYLWKLIQKYNDNLTPDDNPYLGHLISRAINYYEDFVAPYQKPRSPSLEEAEAITALVSALQDLTLNSNPEEIQQVFYDIGKEFFGKESLQQWFKSLYEIVFGLEKGPRLGTFVSAVGLKETIAILKATLKTAL